MNYQAQDYEVKTLTLKSGFTTHTFLSLSFNFSATSLIFASIAFFLTLCGRSSWNTVSTIPAIFPVSNEVIFDSKSGICASGKVVFGVNAVRFAGEFAAGAAEVWPPLVCPSRPGRAGTAKVVPEGVHETFLEAIMGLSSTAGGTNVNGSMGVEESEGYRDT